MLCVRCSKKDATSIFVTPNSKEIKYLCGECYSLIKSEIEIEKLSTNAVDNVKIEQVCKNCGLTYKELINTSYFGCERCYDTFKSYIEQNIIPNFKNKKYKGKRPNAFYVEKEIKHLQQMVEICLKNNNLQKATEYGKQIQKLKEENYGRL